MVLVSEANVAIVREAVLLFTARDIAGLATLYTADALSVAPDDWPEGGRFEGREAVMRQYARLLEEWGTHSMRIGGELTTGDWVVLSLIWDAEGRPSEAPISMTVVGTFRLESERIAEARFFWDFDEALEAVGLGE